MQREQFITKIMTSKIYTTILSRNFYWLTSATLFFFLVMLITNYRSGCIHGEVLLFHFPHAIQNGIGFKMFDFVRSFDVWSFDGFDRARFLSYMIQIFNVKLRLWLLQYWPLPPSFSLTWLGSLLVAPILLFKTVKNMTQNSLAALNVVLLYACSVGLLSHVLFWFHPAKPLASLFLIAAMYFGSKIEVTDKNGSNFKTYIFLFLTIFLAFFADETSYITYLLIPLLFPNVILKRSNWGIYLAYISLPCIYLLFVTFIVPQITISMFSRPFLYWDLILGTGPYATTDFKGSVFSVFDWAMLLKNIQIVFVANFGLPITHPLWLRNILPVFIIVYVIYLIHQSTNISLKRANKKIAFIVFIFLLLQSLVQARHAHQLTFDGYYEGSMFSVLISMLIGIALANQTGWQQILNRLFLIAIMFIQYKNFILIHHQRLEANWLSAYNTYGAQSPNLIPSSQYEFHTIYKIWQNWHNNKTLHMVKNKPLPISLYWLKMHLEAIEQGQNV